MKKPVSLLVIAAVLIMGISGCKGASRKAAQSDERDGGKSGALKIALLLPGLLGDKSFFDAAGAAAPLLEQELGAQVKVVEMGTDQTRWLPTFIDYCEGGYDLIMTVTSAINDVLLQSAEDYPKQKFMNIDCGAKVTVPPNVYIMESNMGEMGYLAGIVAALKVKELGGGNIGFIGGMDIPDINEFLIGYIDGAQYINPNIRVSYSFVGDFADPGKAKENALVMYAGIPVIYQAAGGSGLGVFSAAREMTEKGSPRFAIGVDSDQALELKAGDPAAAGLIITSTVKRITDSTLEAVIGYTKGEVSFGKQEQKGLKDKAISLAKNEFYEKLLSAESRKIVDDVEADIISGKIVPRKTKGLSAEEIDAIRRPVRP
ncbi:MAG: BMP family ABC transporter substrate-binding protein [Spirochaetaceae bacterium]|jgi:basic membrane protein A|nr:BMP family ABC transporter substrate-binding protein [Spirochaetaceae bacterium]